MSTVNSKEIKEVSDEMSKSLKNIKNYLEQMSDSSSRLSKYANLLQECNGKYVEGSLLPNYVEHVLNGQIIKDKNFTVSLSYLAIAPISFTFNPCLEHNFSKESHF